MEGHARYVCPDCGNEIPAGWYEPEGSGSKGTVVSRPATVLCLNHEDFPREMNREPAS